MQHDETSLTLIPELHLPLPLFACDSEVDGLEVNLCKPTRFHVLRQLVGQLNNSGAVFEYAKGPDCTCEQSRQRLALGRGASSSGTLRVV